MSRHHKIQRIAVGSINVGANPLRPLDGEEVKRLAVSMGRIGLLTPVTVRYHENVPSQDGEGDDSYELIAGRHRLAAAISLGWGKIDVIEIECSDVDAKLWEIAENLHRAELTKLQHDEQVALWIKLTEGGLSQVAKNPKGGRPGAVSAASKELGIDKDAAHRAIKVASLSDEAKAAAVKHKLDDNRSALLEAAKESGPKAQVARIVERAGKKVTPKAKPAPRPIVSDDPIEPPDENETESTYKNLQKAVRLHADLSIALASLFTDQDVALLVSKRTCNGDAEVIVAAARRAEASWGALAARIEKAAGLDDEDVGPGRIALKAKADRAEARSRAASHGAE